MTKNRLSFLSFVEKEMELLQFSALLSLLNLLLYHFPFFKFVYENINMGGMARIMLAACLFILVVVVNFFAFYLLIFLLRRVGQFLIGVFFALNGAAVYFILTYKIIIDDTMMANLFNTQYSEASAFFNVWMVVSILFLGVLPAAYVMAQRVNYGSWKRFGCTMGISLGVILVSIGCNTKNFLWVGEHDTELGGLVLPWSYVVNTCRMENAKARESQQEILLPDAKITNDEPSVMVLVIGESARRDHFSLYGYERCTNPLLSAQERLHTYLANSCNTYTMACTKSILEYKEENDLYEILPNYLYRNGVDVYWRTTNWGQPPVHIAHFQEKEYVRANCTCGDAQYDEALVCGLRELIESSDSSKVLVVLHTSTSHGPKYTEKYPKRFEVFTPVSDKVESVSRSNDQLINAYDNTIVYTDYLLNRVIEQLKEIEGRHTAMLYLSDHGESLGENDLFMHGVPMSIAPKEQIEIPFLLWTSDDWRTLKPVKEATQHHVFHTVMDFLSVESPVFDPEMDLFEP